MTINYETQTTGTELGHAVGGEDFIVPVDGSNSVTSSGSDSIAITILPDDIDEPNETFKVVITSVTGGGAVLTSTVSALLLWRSQ